MTSYFPATADTYVVEVNSQASEGFVRTPVLGWVVEEGRPLPMTLNGKNTLVAGAAVLHPSGMVEDSISQYSFENTETWLESNPEAGRQNPKSAPAKHTKPKTGAQERDEDAVGEGAYDIEWTSGTFKSNSWWRYDDGEHEFVFQIDGGEELPKATDKVEKIKRTDFMEMKKTVDVLTVDEIMNAEPLDVATEEDDEDDDTDDLI